MPGKKDRNKINIGVRGETKDNGNGKDMEAAGQIP